MFSNIFMVKMLYLDMESHTESYHMIIKLEQATGCILRKLSPSERKEQNLESQ